MHWPAWLIAMLLGYLSGSIPFALLIGLAHGLDIRRLGSGNIGATNCARVVGLGWGALCFALDLLKGLGPALAAGWWFGLLGGTDPPDAAAAAAWLGVAVAAVLGHICPLWLGFRGGKGVATGFGAMLGVWPYLTVPAAAAAVTWLLVAGVTRYVSVASVAAAMVLPLYLAVTASVAGWPMRQCWPFLLVTAAMAVLILFRHRSNLRRVRAGTEGRLGE